MEPLKICLKCNYCIATYNGNGFEYTNEYIYNCGISKEIKIDNVTGIETILYKTCKEMRDSRCGVKGRFFIPKSTSSFKLFFKNIYCKIFNSKILE